MSKSQIKLGGLRSLPRQSETEIQSSANSLPVAAHDHLKNPCIFRNEYSSFRTSTERASIDIAKGKRGLNFDSSFNEKWDFTSRVNSFLLPEIGHNSKVQRQVI